MELNKLFLSKKIIEILLIFLPIALIFSNILAEFIIVVLIIFYLSIQKIENQKSDLKDPIIFFLLIIWAYLVINYFININKDPSFLRTFFFIRYPLLILSISFFLNSLNLNEKKIFSFWAIIILIACIDLNFQFFKKTNIIGEPAILQGEVYRLGGFMGDELKISNLIFHFGVLAFIYSFSKKIKKNKIGIMNILFLLILIISIFLTAERSNFATVALFFIILNFYLLKKNMKLSLIIFSFLSAILILFSINNKELSKRMTNTIFNEIKNLKYESDKSFLNKNSHYFTHYSTAYQIFKKNPYFGIGIKNFRFFCDNDEFNKDIHPAWKNKKCATHPHNYYFEFLSELGIVGFVLIIYFFIFSFIRFFRSKDNFIILGSFILLLSFIPFLPRGSFFNNWNSIIFWTVFAFIYSRYAKFISSK